MFTHKMSTRRFSRRRPSLARRNPKPAIKARQAMGPPPRSITYTGPLKNLASDANNTDLRTVELHELGAFSHSGSGVVFQTLQIDPQNALDFANWASNYSEYRVLGCRIDVTPENRYVANFPSGIVAVDHVTAPATLATLDDLASYASARQVNYSDPFYVEWRMSGTEEAMFESTSATTSVGNIYLGSSTMASPGSSNLFIHWMVQFRGRS